MDHFCTNEVKNQDSFSTDDCYEYVLEDCEKCDYCGEDMATSDLQTHHVICPKFLIPCVISGCESIVVRDQLSEHNKLYAEHHVKVLSSALAKAKNQCKENDSYLTDMITKLKDTVAGYQERVQELTKTNQRLSANLYWLVHTDRTVDNGMSCGTNQPIEQDTSHQTKLRKSNNFLLKQNKCLLSKYFNQEEELSKLQQKTKGLELLVQQHQGLNIITSKVLVRLYVLCLTTSLDYYCCISNWTICRTSQLPVPN
jgi:hypothetical protein